LIVFDAEENEEQIQELMEPKAHILSFRFFEPYESRVRDNTELTS